jgi:hypothetical protein
MLQWIPPQKTFHIKLLFRVMDHILMKEKYCLLQVIMNDLPLLLRNIIVFNG